MQTDKWAVLFQLTFMLSMALLLPGCIILPDESESRGVKLSDAMKSSASGDQHNLGGSSSHESSSEYYIMGEATSSEGDHSGGGGSDLAGASYDQSEYAWQGLFSVSYDTPLNSDFLGITHFTLTPVAIEDERNFLGLYIGGAAIQFKQGTLPAQAVSRTWMLDSGLTYRRYLNSSKTALSPYLSASAGFFLMSWSYRSQVFAGNEAIQSDSIDGAEGTIALGISTRRDSRLSFFGEVGIGGTAFSNTTTQGFDNDVFHDFGFLSVKAGLSLKF